MDPQTKDTEFINECYLQGLRSFAATKFFSLIKESIYIRLKTRPLKFCAIPTNEFYKKRWMLTPHLI